MLSGHSSNDFSWRNIMVEIISMIFNGVWNGLGTATGSYFATKYAIKIWDEKAHKKIKKMFKKK